MAPYYIGAHVVSPAALVGVPVQSKITVVVRNVSSSTPLCSLKQYLGKFVVMEALVYKNVMFYGNLLQFFLIIEERLTKIISHYETS